MPDLSAYKAECTPSCWDPLHSSVDTSLTTTAVASRIHAQLAKLPAPSPWRTPFFYSYRRNAQMYVVIEPVGTTYESSYTR